MCCLWNWIEGLGRESVFNFYRYFWHQLLRPSFLAAPTPPLSCFPESESRIFTLQTSGLVLWPLPNNPSQGGAKKCLNNHRKPGVLRWISFAYVFYPETMQTTRPSEFMPGVILPEPSHLAGRENFPVQAALELNTIILPETMMGPYRHSLTSSFSLHPHIWKGIRTLYVSLTL